MLEDKSSDEAKRLFEATIAFEHASLRPLYLLNGGAVVAVLAFAGGAPQYAEAMVRPIVWWVVGLVFAALTTFAGYSSQLQFYKRQRREDNEDQDGVRRHGRLGKYFRLGAYCAGGTSLVCFCVGALIAAYALSHFKPS